MKIKDLFHRLSPQARILLVRLRSMGDCFLLTGPIRVLKQEFPGFRVAVLVESRFAGCFDGNPDIDEIIVADGKLRTAGRLITRRFDAILNLHGGPTSLVYSCLAIGKRVGFEQYQYSKLYHALAPAPDSSAHTVNATMAFFRLLGVRALEAPPLRYEIHPNEARRLAEKFKGRPYVVIHPASVMATKRWESKRFAQVAREFSNQYTIVVTAGPGEESFAGEVAKEISGTVILLGLTIPELAELIRGAKLYVGNDSGPMHLAAAVRTPIVAVWGSSDSRRWHPWRVAHRVVQNPFECNPCPGYRCLVAESPLCIESVTAEQVTTAAGELLASK